MLTKLTAFVFMAFQTVVMAGVGDKVYCPKKVKKENATECGGSVFHTYSCYGYDGKECAWQLETWVYITMIVLGVLSVLIALFGCLRSCCK